MEFFTTKIIELATRVVRWALPSIREREEERDAALVRIGRYCS